MELACVNVAILCFNKLGTSTMLLFAICIVFGKSIKERNHEINIQYSVVCVCVYKYKNLHFFTSKTKNSMENCQEMKYIYITQCIKLKYI